MGRRTGSLLAAAVAAVGLAACGGGGGGAKTTAHPHGSTQPVATNGPAAAQGLDIKLEGSGHHPVAGKDWPLTVRVSHDGRPVDGTISYVFAFHGQPVAQRSHYLFKHGRFHDTLQFPKRAVGIPLTLRVVVATKYGRRTVDYPFTARAG